MSLAKPPLRSGELANIYCSYAPSDREFVDKLAAAFTQRRTPLWFDTIDSLLTAEIEVEIYARINAAEHFLLVMSAHSLADPRCRKELEFALQKKKRVVIALRDGDPALVLHESVQQAQVFSFGPRDEFTRSFQAMYEAVKGQLKLSAFISYSRKDQDFVDRLAQGFEADQRPVWIDRKAIQHTEEWLAATLSGIETADNFVFVISEASVTSKTCRKEIDHAARHNKRFIPILYRNPQSTIPPEVDKYQRIDFPPDADFDLTFRSVLEAIDTDFEYVHLHTWLAQRAKDWDQNQDDDFLLRGDELTRAKKWLAQIDAEKKPQPTALQKGFVDASLSQAKRLLFWKVGIAALVMVLLGSVGAWAISRALEARRQRAAALSRQLVSIARVHFRDDLSLALLLMLEAGVVDDTVEARSGLLEAVQQRGSIVAFLDRRAGSISGLAYSSDGQLIASAGGDEKVLLWNATTHKPDGKALEHEFTVQSLVFGSKTKTLAVSGTNQIAIWDVGSRQQKTPLLSITKGTIERVVFSPEERVLATCSSSGSVNFWDTTNWQPLGDPWEFGSTLKSLAFSPSGELLVVAAWDQSTVWDFKSHKLIHTLSGIHTGAVNQVEFTPDGKLIASGSDDGTVVLWNVQSGKTEGSRLETHSGVNSLAFLEHGKYLVSAADDGRVLVWNLETRKEAAVHLFSGIGVTHVAVNQENYVGVVGDRQGNVVLLNLVPDIIESPLQAMPAFTGSTAADCIAFSPDGKLLAVAYQDNRTVIYDLIQHKALEPALEQDSPVTALTFSPDGSTLMSGSLSGTVSLWDLSQQKSRTIKLDGAGAVAGIAYAPQANMIAVGFSGQQSGGSALTGFRLRPEPAKVFLLDQNTYQPIGEPISKFEESVRAVAFGRAGKILAVGLTNGEIVFFNTDDKHQIELPLRGHQQIVYSLAFNSAGTLIASAGGDGTILLWDVEHMKLESEPLRGHRELVKSVAFSPDGKLLASGSQDLRVNLWDVVTRQRIGLSFLGHSLPVESVAFSPDGRMLVSAGQDGRINFWSVRVDDWKQQACAIANRNLTASEWANYLPNQDYRSTCLP